MTHEPIASPRGLLGRALKNALPAKRSITSRRHPLVFSAYLMVFTIGLIFITGWLDTGKAEAALFAKVSHIFVWMWEYELLLGGALGLLALSLKPRVSPKWPDLADLLHFEAIGALLSGAGVTTYVLAIATVLGWHEVGPSAVILGCLAVGLAIRSYMALTEARHVERLGRVVDAVRALAPEQLAGTDTDKE